MTINFRIKTPSEGRENKERKDENVIYCASDIEAFTKALRWKKMEIQLERSPLASVSDGARGKESIIQLFRCTINN